MNGNLAILDDDDVDFGMVAKERRVLVIGMRPAGDDEALRVAGLDQARELALERPVPGVAAQAEDVDVPATYGASSSSAPALR